MNINQTDSTIRDDHFITSEHADPNNVIMDTCALQSLKTLEVLESSKKVTVLLTTIEEMDMLKYSLNKKKEADKLDGCDKFILYYINQYAKKFLIETEKYQLLPFDLKDDSYTDNKILKYLTSLSPNERPTLLTSDVLFAAKARCLSLEYILYIFENPNKDLRNISTDITDTLNETETVNADNSIIANVDTAAELKETNIDTTITDDIPTDSITDNELENDSKSNLGVGILCDTAGSIKIKSFNPYVEIMYVLNGDCYTISKDCCTIENCDYIAVMVKCKGVDGVKIQKIRIQGKEKSKTEYVCKSINTIYSLDKIFHDEILDNMKKILLI